MIIEFETNNKKMKLKNNNYNTGQNLIGKSN